MAPKDSTLARNRAIRGFLLVVNPRSESRERMCRLLDGAGYHPVGAETAEQALEIARRDPVGLAILEVSLPDLCGYAVCRTLKEEFGDELPVVFVSAVRTESYDRVAGFLVGADDYIVEPFAPDEFLLRVRARLRRSIPVTPVADYNLTAREFEVLALISQGLGQKEIATQLFLSPKTIGTHTERIYRKLGVRSRVQAVAVAYRDQLVGAIGEELERGLGVSG
jgi:DNA-binding NarL/FixJ family response regulator